MCLSDNETYLVALDPGKNLGIAVVAADATLIKHLIIHPNELLSYPLPADSCIIVGNGTGSPGIQQILQQRGLGFEIVDEQGTSLEARELYFKTQPLKGLWRLLPKGLWPLPEPIDDYAAYAIALRYLRQGKNNASHGIPNSE